MIYGILLIISILIFLILLLIYEYSNVKKQLERRQHKLEKENSFLIREKERLKWQISILEKKEEIVLKISDMRTEELIYNPIFKGKRAMVGNYDRWSLEETRKILKSFGMSVDIVKKGDDIVDRIENNYEYDIIFTNKVYQHGSNGVDTLKRLKKIDGFSTPVVIHTLSKGKRDYFINLGFDEYIEKPIVAGDRDKVKEIENVLRKLLVKADQ